MTEQQTKLLVRAIRALVCACWLGFFALLVAFFIAILGGLPP